MLHMQDVALKGLVVFRLLATVLCLLQVKKSCESLAGTEMHSHGQ